MGALSWLLIPLFAGTAAGVWAWLTERRRPSPPDHDTWEDLDRYQRLRTALSGNETSREAELATAAAGPGKRVAGSHSGPAVSGPLPKPER